MEQFCRQFVNDIFVRYDKDNSNFLESNELNGWVQSYLNTHSFLNEKMIKDDFEYFFRKVDSDNDRRIDRWDLFDYCLKNVTPDEDF